ncbi:MAG: hypothetical protein C4576_13830 [Desulfobacteraceae bacterium]|nr:MAG: hypothetical protein C4576_13830 [Desulfobacteraceae bacterium]
MKPKSFNAISNKLVLPKRNQFIVQGWIMGSCTSPFPTHTHGLFQKDWPEFFIDPLAFGTEGNAQRIVAIHEFLSKPENRHLLDSVLQGNVVKVTDGDIFPGKTIDEPNTYCLREVPRSFQGAKMVYPAYQDETYPEGTKLRIVQIWVEGDDYAIEDDYYRGGVRW